MKDNAIVVKLHREDVCIAQVVGLAVGFGVPTSLLGLLALVALGVRVGLGGINWWFWKSAPEEDYISL